jgi:hypothetical protein
MRLYSDYSGARTRQVFSDVTGVLSLALIGAIATAVTASVRAFGGPSDLAAGAGESVAAADAAQQASIETVAVRAGASLALF